VQRKFEPDCAKVVAKKINNKRLLSLCFFLYGQPFLLAALKKAFTRNGTAFVRG
jgi:hypothetical protein